MDPRATNYLRQNIVFSYPEMIQVSFSLFLSLSLFCYFTLSLIFIKIILVLLLFYLFIFMKIIVIFSCSGMFRNVPACSGMFRHVPECSMFLVLSTPLYFCYFKMEERREERRRGFRFTEDQQYASRDFRKAFYAIRTVEEGHHIGMACAVETEDENDDKIRLVTCSDTWNSVSNSVQMVRFSRKHFGDYRLTPAPSSVRQCEQFSIIWCEIGGKETWAKRRLLRPRFLEGEEQKNDFLVYTIDGQSCLNLEYDKASDSHDLKDSGEITYELGGSPIISLNKKYLVGVLKSDGKACFLFHGVFGE